MKMELQMKTLKKQNKKDVQKKILIGQEGKSKEVDFKVISYFFVNILQERKHGEEKVEVLVYYSKFFTSYFFIKDNDQQTPSFDIRIPYNKRTLI